MHTISWLTSETLQAIKQRARLECACLVLSTGQAGVCMFSALNRPGWSVHVQFSALNRPGWSVHVQCSPRTRQERACSVLSVGQAGGACLVLSTGQAGACMWPGWSVHVTEDVKQ
jgi:trimethylamine:corrinoid methyltransferase-like protein